jgi:hypothetical protein
MVNTNCECGHEKRDHALPLMGVHGRGPCKVCLCDLYVKAKPAPVATAATVSAAN